VGQEPVEAVESERNGPDTGHDTRNRISGKDIAQKNRPFIAENLDRQMVLDRKER
jgi:hypothetical protein